MDIPFPQSTQEELKKRFPSYLAFGEIVNTNDKIAEISQEILSKDSDERSLLISLRRWLNKYVYDADKKPIGRAKNILESRLTPATELLELRFASCGSLATLGASILRNLGVPVKLIDGSFPGTDNHAWVEVYFPDTNKWVPFDFTGKGDKETGGITPDHHKITECADWSEIKGLLEQKHQEYLDRKASTDQL